MHRGDERAEAGIDDAARQEQLKRIGWNTEEIEEKRHRDIETAEEGHQPGEGEPRIVRHTDDRVGEPPGEEHETDRQQLPGVREVERRRDDDVRQRRGGRIGRADPCDQRLAGFDQHRQDDEQVAGDEGRHQRIPGEAEDLPHPDRRQRGNQAREDPQAHQERDQHIADQIHLQPSELFEAQGAGSRGGDGKEAVRREPRDESSQAGQRVPDDAEHVEQHLFPFDADQRRAKEHREQHDGRDDVVRE